MEVNAHCNTDIDMSSCGCPQDCEDSRREGKLSQGGMIHVLWTEIFSQINYSNYSYFFMFLLYHLLENQFLT